MVQRGTSVISKWWRRRGTSVSLKWESKGTSAKMWHQDRPSPWCFVDHYDVVLGCRKFFEDSISNEVVFLNLLFEADTKQMF